MPEIIDVMIIDDSAVVRGALTEIISGGNDINLIATAAQDEKSCVVFGMPGEAIKKDAHCSIVPLNRIAKDIQSKL